MVAFVAALGAIFALAVPGATAQEGEYKSLNVSRGFTLGGDRDKARVDMKVTDASPGASLSVSFGVGASQFDNISVQLVQEGGDNSSRLVKLWYVGEFSEGQAKNCTGNYFVECRRGGYDWVKGREYRVVIDRGGRTDAGRLWTVNIKDLATGAVTPLLSVRSPYDKLSTPFNGASLALEPNQCSAVNTSVGVVDKPVVPAGSTVAWQDKIQRVKEGCTDATLSAPLDSGVLRLKIAE